MQSSNVSISGAITLWELSGRSNYSMLADGLKNLGLQQYIPHKPTALEALKLVLTNMFAGTRSLIRPLEGYKGWGVVYEQANGNHLQHHNDISITVRGKNLADIAFYGTTWDQEQLILSQVTAEMELIPQAKLVYSLKRIIESLCGVPIRESGGVYFIPDPAMPMWRNVSAIIESAGANTVHVIRTAVDDSMVKCVVAHIEREVRDFIAIAEGEASAGMKERAKANRLSDTEFMIEKAKWYEREFGVLLTDTTKALDELSVKLLMDGDWSGLGME